MSAKRKNRAAFNLEILELLERELIMWTKKAHQTGVCREKEITKYFHHMLVDKTRVNNRFLRLKMAGEQWINLVHVRMLKKV